MMASFLLFFHFQNETESSIKQNMITQLENNQKDNVRSIAEHIKSDFDKLRLQLKTLSILINLQDGNLSSEITKSLFQEFYEQITSVTAIDRLFVIDEKDISRLSLVPEGEPSYLGMNFSDRNWVVETRKTMSPVFSEAFVGKDGKYRIAITYPIIENNSGNLEYNGLVGVVVPTTDFFRFYGNIFDIEEKYLAALDKNKILLVHPLNILAGKPFFGDFFQNYTGNNDILNHLVRTVTVEGKPATAIYDFVNGERLNTGYPIIYDDEVIYSIFIITPTSTIYSTINEIITKERYQMLSLIIGIIGSVSIMVLLLSRFNTILNNEIQKRTNELEEANKKLVSANEHLKVNDQLQKEFIHTAAHELRTPVQSILGFSQLLFKKEGNSESFREYIKIINRNSMRLKMLINRVLDITQLDSNTFDLKKERFEFIEFLSEIINEYKNETKGKSLIKNDIQISIRLHPKKDQKLWIYADKLLIHQVMTNLIDNAIEFSTKGGRIIIEVFEDNVKKEINIKIIDSGIGINQEILPILFNKFVSRSSKGTGLGLYLSKKIIEEHGGRIWAQNNPDKPGATFFISLPV